MQHHIALGQINSTVGDLAGNAAKVLAYTRRAVKGGASIVVFPELTLSGYPPEDLVLKRHFIEDCWTHLTRLAQQVPEPVPVLVGVPQKIDQQVYNSAALLQGGRVIALYQKMILPNYGVFDEKRVFGAGKIPLVIQAGDLRIGVHICEDSWYLNMDAVQLLKEAQLDCLINLSASPYHRGKRLLREQVLRQTATYLNCGLAYCNLVGAQDELVFDGGSLVLDSSGDILARAPQFEEALLVASLPKRADQSPVEEPTPPLRRIVNVPSLPVGRHHGLAAFSDVTPLMDDHEEVYTALKTGLRDYVEKNGFKKVVVALSGGIDSALVAAIAVDTLGADRVAGVTMPSRFSSEGTRSDAELLARNLNIEFHTVPIADLHESYLSQLRPLWPDSEENITEENLQARIRGTIIMALSNKFNWLVLTTGNKSELATGYCTLYGDMVGGYALIKDVPKMLVYSLSVWRNQQADQPVIPPSTIERPPSAELRPDQKDSDSLPPYDILDAIIELYVEKDQGVDQIVTEGFDPLVVRKVSRLVDHSEYKRRQGAPGVKITPKAFGRDRRMPITNAYREYVKGMTS